MINFGHVFLHIILIPILSPFGTVALGFSFEFYDEWQMRYRTGHTEGFEFKDLIERVFLPILLIIYLLNYAPISVFIPIWAIPFLI